jgi:hypothetical protein
MSNPNQEKIREIIKQQGWLMNALRDVRDLKLPDWYLAAGAIRNTLWNYLHNYPTTYNQKDIDVAYFDILDMNGKREKLSEELLKEKSPNLKWEVVNQARGHLFNPLRPRVNSSGESIAYWSEIPTCIGIKLEINDALTICSPHGLDDLMSLIVRPIPPPYQELSLYRQRINEKQWEKFWPKLKIVRY